MNKESFTLTGVFGERTLQISAKRYRFQNYEAHQAKGGIILLLLHGAGFPKETFEPLLNELNNIQGSGSLIKEAWTYDCPNHGESAVLNDKKLFTPPPDCAPIAVSLENYSRSGLYLLMSGLVDKGEHDLIIAVGHSVGTSAAIYLGALYQQLEGKLFDFLVLIEPPSEMFSQVHLTEQKSTALVALTKKRRDIWASKEEALTWMSKRPPWKTWNKDALDAYVEYGLCSLPTSGYPTIQQGVTLCCHRMHEVYPYSEISETNKVKDLFSEVHKSTPIYVICGGKSFLGPNDSEREEIASKPGISLYFMPEADHLMVQEIPKELAQVLYQFLNGVNFNKSKL